MENNRIHIGLAGDVMIGRTVDKAISRNGYEYPWGDLLPLLKSTDMNIINLETTLTTSQQLVNKTFNFKAGPDKIKTLEVAKITAVNLANNHILDFSEAGLVETAQVLKNANIKYAGAGINEAEAASPVFVKGKDISVGMLGFTDNEPGWKAGPSHYGVNYINISKRADREKALGTILQLKKRADIVLISIHWGPNMKEEPDEEYVEFAHDMINCGADIIHGHSAHIFQGIEIYKRKLILYDTGDFVDDYVVNPYVQNDHSFFFIAEMDKKGLCNLKLIPILISNYQVNHAKEEDRQWSIERMQKLSSRFGTEVTDAGELVWRNEL